MTTIMKKFKVTVQEITIYEIVVEADNEDEAKSLAEEAYIDAPVASSDIDVIDIVEVKEE